MKRFYVSSKSPSINAAFPFARDIVWARALVAMFKGEETECHFENAEGVGIDFEFPDIEIPEDGKMDPPPHYFYDVYRCALEMHKCGVIVNHLATLVDDDDYKDAVWFMGDLDDPEHGLEPVSKEFIVEQGDS